MSNVAGFLTINEEEEIVQAILEAERNTSGEIRVHIESTTQLSHEKRAVEVFHTLKMFNTLQRNGVLIYIAVSDHQLVIYGDRGINDVVSNDFWDATRDVIQQNFKQQNFKKGIIEGVLQIGKELKLHFPWNKNDIDELPNTVSKG